MPFPNDYCVVEADTNRYYADMAKQDAYDDGLQEYIRDNYIDTLLWKGEVTMRKWYNTRTCRWQETKVFMWEAIDAYISAVEGEDNSNYMLLSAAVIQNKEGEEHLQALRDYAEMAVEWYFMEFGEGQLLCVKEYEKYLEEDY